MNLEIWFAWCLACVVISITPGAGAINAMSNGIQYGVRHSVPAVMGQQLGLILQFIIVGVGLGSLLASSTHMFEIIKWLGAAYLIWMGIQKWRQPFIPLKNRTVCELENKRRFWQSTLVNLTNPKATIFLIALLPQFINPDSPQISQFSIMMLTSISIDIIVMLSFAALANTLVIWMKQEKYQRRLNHFFGGLFIVAAGLMASFQRS